MNNKSKIIYLVKAFDEMEFKSITDAAKWLEVSRQTLSDIYAYNVQQFEAQGYWAEPSTLRKIKRIFSR